MATELNVLENFDPKIPEGGADAEVLMLGNLHPAVQLAVLERMKKRPQLVVLDTMNFWMDLTWDLLLDVIAKTDVITINDEEARQLSGEYSLVKAAKKIHALGPKYVIIKKENTERFFSTKEKYLQFRLFYWKMYSIQQEQEIHLPEDSWHIWQNVRNLISNP